MTLITPSILAVEEDGLVNATMMADKGGADWIHLDIMDGHFVPNLTYGPGVVKLIRQVTDLPCDAHLMVTNPDVVIPPLLDMGVEYITVHQEVCKHLHKTLSTIKDGGAKAGVALNPATPLEMIMPILPMLDLIVIMAVNPGFAGQKHIPESAAKVSRFSQIVRNNKWEGIIQVDGGINLQTLPAIMMAGADCLVAGASVFRRAKPGTPESKLSYQEQITKNIKDLKIACDVAIEEGVDSM